MQIVWYLNPPDNFAGAKGGESESIPEIVPTWRPMGLSNYL